MTRATVAAVLATVATLTAAAPASAHIQISPTVAAPDDAVLFQLLVPNEREDDTVEIRVQIPKGVLAFSFEDTPGWRRTTTNAADGSIGVVRWTGHAPKGGFVRFAFLASTPEKAGDIDWKAIQRYADGTTVRWIGAPDSDYPAAVTHIQANAPVQNAGGESEGKADDGAVAATPEARGTPSATVAVAAATSDAHTRDPLAIALGSAGLLLGAVSLVVALRRRPPAST